MTTPLLQPAAILFDLDGTLVDSAPDLGGAVNEMREARGLASLPLTELRAWCGSGARGMIGAGFGVKPDDDAFVALRDEFFARYEARLTRQTEVFADVSPVLARLREIAIPWGIVTNKATRFAAPLIEALGLAATAATLVCGDTTPHAKPHPAPLLEAARRVGVEPERCWYVGDDHRDVVAGRAAGMATIVAGWGYLGTHAGAVDTWGADRIVERADGLIGLLKASVGA